MEEFQKVQMLRLQEVEAAISDLDPADTEAVQRVVQLAADRVVDYRMHEKFGCFQGGKRCVVFACMGAPQAFLREELSKAGVQELGVAVAPEDERYVWAVPIDSPDGEFWVERSRYHYLRQPWDSSSSGGEAS